MENNQKREIKKTLPSEPQFSRNRKRATLEEKSGEVGCDFAVKAGNF
jgi:hypothetical protein